MTEVIEPGDVVTLKSGGTPMTVTLVVEDLAYCTWFEKDGRMSTGIFRLFMIKKVPANQLGVSGA
jgi:uncharacterized protein YodC (DUF2158 family)